jgi:hypothetical protein
MKGSEQQSEAAEKAADKVRRTAEAEASRPPQQNPSETTAANDPLAGEAVHDLRHPDLSKGDPDRALPGKDQIRATMACSRIGTGRRRLSNLLLMQLWQHVCEPALIR